MQCRFLFNLVVLMILVFLLNSYPGYKLNQTQQESNAIHKKKIVSQRPCVRCKAEQNTNATHHLNDARHLWRVLAADATLDAEGEHRVRLRGVPIGVAVLSHGYKG